MEEKRNNVNSLSYEKANNNTERGKNTSENGLIKLISEVIEYSDSQPYMGDDVGSRD